MLYKSYKPTDILPESQSAFAAYFPDMTNSPLAGAYDNGLLSIVDEESSKSLLISWAHILGEVPIALATTGFGDVFVWKSNAVYFLEVQHGTTEFVDSEPGWVLSDFLANSEVIDKVLKKPQFDLIVAEKGELKYSQIFILEPWPMLGGVDRVENYEKGDCKVYLDLVGKFSETTE